MEKRSLSERKPTHSVRRPADLAAVGAVTGPETGAVAAARVRGRS
ncbi:hypothetical protein CPER28S_03128 [Cellulomonas persica]